VTNCGELAGNCGEPGDGVLSTADPDTPDVSDTPDSSADPATVLAVDELPELLTGAEVCQLLHISKSTLQPWREDGTLSAVPLGAGRARKTWRYPKGQPTIQAALAALRTGQ